MWAWGECSNQKAFATAAFLFNVWICDEQTTKGEPRVDKRYETRGEGKGKKRLTIKDEFIAQFTLLPIHGASDDTKQGP